VLEYIVTFTAWTLYLYTVHRLAHITPIVKDIHRRHHLFALTNNTSWHWNNLFFYNDNLEGTLDFWITEVIPNLVFCYILNAWWIFIMFWIYSGILQENIEHNKNISFPFFTAGQWHLLHHRKYNKNFGIYTPIWDKLFGTEECIN